ncbi:MAG: endonuclease [Bacteroidales bacterium]|nr:endonuclease [Bacteroidales bacterium]
MPRFEKRITVQSAFLEPDTSAKQQFSILFYNLENLYDTIDDPTKNDDDFLPASPKKWNTGSYYNKLRNISKVIIASGAWHNPDIIGVAEVENKNCLFDLTHKTALSRKQYEIVHYDSPDRRGIDVALLYNPHTFTVIYSQALPVYFGNSQNSTTRDVLYVKGCIQATHDSLHVFVCHFPSRLGGKTASNAKRAAAAQVVRFAIDSIQAQQTEAHIVIMGDFNDTPADESIAKILNVNGEYNDTCLMCLTNIIDYRAQGTHCYKNEWSFLDQTIVSNAVVHNYSVISRVQQHDFLFETSKKTGMKTPFRSYKGTFYTKGYSDHLPVLLSLWYSH